MKARCLLFAIAVLLSGVRVASAQCYTFSSGSASFMVDITGLPSPTMPSPGVYQYSSGSGNASLTEGGTTYTSSGPISLIVTVSSDSSIDFSAFDLDVSFTTADNTIAGASVSLGWTGIFFPNGSLPAALPPIPGSLDPFMVVDVNFAETNYTPDSVGGCSVTSPAPPSPTPPSPTPPSPTPPSPAPPPEPSGPAPSIKAGGVVPVGSGVPIIQPGEWVSIYGTNLATSTMAWNGDFPTFLNGTSVTINGQPAYLSFVSGGQINVQAPSDTTTGTVPVVVTTAGGSSTATVTLSQFAPSFFLLDAKHVAGIIFRPDGSGAYGGGSYDILGPTGTSLGYPTVAAKPGDIVELYGNGFGPTNPAVPAGQVFFGPAYTTNPVTLLINHVSEQPTFAGLTGAGLYQINLTVPAGLGTGDVPLVATVGGSRTPSNVVISLQ